MSSVLLDHYGVSDFEKRWRRINLNDFTYFGVLHDSVKNHLASGLELNIYAHRQGFLYGYAKTTWENDFNSFAKYLLTDWKYFWYLLDDFPVLCEKALLTIEFYSHIDPRWNWEYFHSLAF
ncbi:MAG TPA: hypothetical protein ENJ82_10475 [Bacteroidetes bacterium]|nr:hypothetical protein [Bacteroidota bacterium]